MADSTVFSPEGTEAGGVVPPDVLAWLLEQDNGFSWYDVYAAFLDERKREARADRVAERECSWDGDPRNMFLAAAFESRLQGRSLAGRDIIRMVTGTTVPEIVLLQAIQAKDFSLLGAEADGLTLSAEQVGLFLTDYSRTIRFLLEKREDLVHFYPACTYRNWDWLEHRVFLKMLSRYIAFLEVLGRYECLRYFLDGVGLTSQLDAADVATSRQIDAYCRDVSA